MAGLDLTGMKGIKGIKKESSLRHSYHKSDVFTAEVAKDAEEGLNLG